MGRDPLYGLRLRRAQRGLQVPIQETGSLSLVDDNRPEAAADVSVDLEKRPAVAMLPTFRQRPPGIGIESSGRRLRCSA